LKKKGGGETQERMGRRKRKKTKKRKKRGKWDEWDEWIKWDEWVKWGKWGKWREFKDRMCATVLYCIALINYNLGSIYIFNMCFSDKKRKELKDKLEERQNLLHPILIKYLEYVSKIK